MNDLHSNFCAHPNRFCSDTELVLSLCRMHSLALPFQRCSACSGPVVAFQVGCVSALGSWHEQEWVSLTCAPPASLRIALLEAQTVRLVARTAKATKRMLLAMLKLPIPELSQAAAVNGSRALYAVSGTVELL